jgi:hypothetical protein
MPALVSADEGEPRQFAPIMHVCQAGTECWDLAVARKRYPAGP